MDSIDIDSMLKDIAEENAYINPRDSQTDNTMVDNQKIIIDVSLNDYLDGKMQLDNQIIVYPHSYITLLFDYPSMEHVTFKVSADNKMKGFTKQELATKVMERFKLLYYIYKNYKTESGKTLFQPVLNEYEYRDNGIYKLKYNKVSKIWKVVLQCYR